MTHTRKMNESEGELSPSELVQIECPKCKKTDCSVQIWESSCGGWEDYKYSCLNPDCRYQWWIDGIDS